MARINPMMFPAFTGMGRQTETPNAPDTLTELTRLLGGDLSGSLSSGDKLLAISGLLRSATRSGRRAGLTPQQVIGDIRQQKLAELQNRMAVEQAQTARTREQEQRRLRTEFLATLPEQERRFASFLGDTALQEYALKRMQGPEPTEAEKKLVAAGIDPKSEQGQRILRNVAASGGIIAVTGPRGTTYVEAGDIVGANQPPPSSNIPAPKTKQEYDALPAGTEFIAPDGVRRVKPGGQTGAAAPSGSFR